ncbi:MAG TPA: hypothetical protein VNG13_01630 [Mycobacteriales bacterium]|nr:hypothetical protein [Mycobacteriales bacterium]
MLHLLLRERPVSGRTVRGCLALAAAVVLVGVTAGCGSTAVPTGPGGANPTGQGGLGTGSAAPGSDAAAGTVPGTAAGAVGAGAQGSGTAGGPGGSTGRTVAGSGPTGAGVATSAPQGSVKAASIAIGFIYPTHTEELTAIGVSGVSTGDPHAQAQAIVDALNRGGGIAGRRIVPLYYGIDTSQYLSNPDPQFQAACAYFTQDNKVFAVVSYLDAEQAGSPGFYYCLAQHNTVFVDDASGITSAEYRKLGPYFYQPSNFLAERGMATYIGGLAAMNWLNPTTKIGVFYVDTSQARDLIAHVIIPMLSARGLKVTAQGGTGTGAGGINDIPGIVLKFRQAGVTNILNLTNPIFFMQQADSQRYYPRYALSSTFSPSTMQTIAPKDQLPGAASIGWQPINDVDQAHDPGPVSANETRCLQLMRNAGQDTSNRTVQMYEAQLCDPMFFLQQALRGATTVSPAVLADRVYALGRSFPSALTFGTFFQRGRPDGAGAYRPSLYDTGCGCFVYTGPTRPSFDPPAS